LYSAADSIQRGREVDVPENRGGTRAMVLYYAQWRTKGYAEVWRMDFVQLMRLAVAPN
jgi:hypothetical protein